MSLLKPGRSYRGLPIQRAAAGVIADYERRNRLVRPLVRAIFSRLAGFRDDGSEPARLKLVQTLPLVAFSPAA